MVHTLLEHGVSHMMVRRAIAQLADYGAWPLSEAPLAVTDGRGRGSCCASARAPSRSRRAAGSGWSRRRRWRTFACGSEDLEVTAVASTAMLRRPLLSAAACAVLAAASMLAAVHVPPSATPTCGRSRASWACGAAGRDADAIDFVGLFNPAPFAVLSGSLVVAAFVAGARARRPRRCWRCSARASRRRCSSRCWPPSATTRLALHGPGGVPERAHDGGR